MVVIGTGEGPPDLEAGIRLADRHEPIYATVGVHPHDASKATPETYKRLAELLKHPKVVALGEIGLDYHYDHSPREVQRAVFSSRCGSRAKPASPSSSTRARPGRTPSRCSKSTGGPTVWAASCTASRADPDQAALCLDLGFHLSFGGI